MRKKESIVKMVFNSIDNVVSAVENIHGDIAEKKGNKPENKIHNGERRNNVYGVIKSINARIGNLVSDFFR
jgi:hypothetical protein